MRRWWLLLPLILVVGLVIYFSRQQPAPEAIPEPTPVVEESPAVTPAAEEVLTTPVTPSQPTMLAGWPSTRWELSMPLNSGKFRYAFDVDGVVVGDQNNTATVAEEVPFRYLTISSSGKVTKEGLPFNPETREVEFRYEGPVRYYVRLLSGSDLIWHAFLLDQLKNNSVEYLDCLDEKIFSALTREAAAQDRAGRVSGRIINEHQEPLEGVALLFQLQEDRKHPYFSRLAISGADGSFETSWLLAGEYRILIANGRARVRRYGRYEHGYDEYSLNLLKDGVVAQHPRFRLKPDETISDMLLQAWEGAVLTGRVKDEKGQAVYRGSVHLQPLSYPAHHPSPTVHVTQTDKGGRFIIGGVAFAEYALQVVHAAYVPYHDSLVLARGERKNVEVVVSKRGGRVKGVVYDEKRQPVPEVGVFVSYSYSYRFGSRTSHLSALGAMTAADGTFVISPLPFDQEVTVYARDRATESSRVSVKLTAEEPEREVELLLSAPETFEVVIEDEEGNPIKGALVSPGEFDSQGRVSFSMKEPLEFAHGRSYQTDEEGKCSLPYLQYRNSMLKVIARGFIPSAFSLKDIEPQGSYSFRLKRGIAIRIKAVDAETDVAVAGFTFSFRLADQEKVLYESGAVTNTQGEYLILEGFPGEASLFFHDDYELVPPSPRGVVRQITGEKQLEEIEVRLKPVPLIKFRGRVINAQTEEPVTGVKVVIRRGDPPYSFYTDEKGEFTTTLQRRDSYRIIIEAADFQRFEEYFILDKLKPEEDEYVYEARLEPLSEKNTIPLVGTVVDEQQRPVGAAQVRCVITGTSDHREQTLATASDEGGNFEFLIQYPKATVTVMAMHERGGGWTDELQLLADTPPEPLTIQLLPFVACRAIVSDQDGQPLSGVRILILDRTMNHRVAEFFNLPPARPAEEEGEYTFTRLPGTYQFVLEKAEYATLRTEHSIKPPEQQLNFTMQGGVRTFGYCKDYEGKPLRHVHYRAFGRDSLAPESEEKELLFESSTRHDGEFYCWSPPEFELRFLFEHYTGGPTLTSTVEARAGEGPLEVILRPPVLVLGKASFEDGSPATAYEIRHQRTLRPDSPGFIQYGEQYLSINHPEGKFAIPMEGKGSLTLQFQAWRDKLSYSATLHREIEIEEGEVNLGTIILKSSTRITGRCLGERSEALPGKAQLKLGQERIGQTTPTKSDGSFVVENVPPEKVLTLELIPDDPVYLVKTMEGLQLRPGTTKELGELYFEKGGAISGNVYDSEGRRFEKGNVQLNSIEQRYGWGTGFEDGRFMFAHKEPGNYKLRIGIHYGMVTVHEEEFYLAQGEHKQLEIMLPPILQRVSFVVQGRRLENSRFELPLLTLPELKWLDLGVQQNANQLTIEELPAGSYLAVLAEKDPESELIINWLAQRVELHEETTIPLEFSNGAVWGRVIVPETYQHRLGTQPLFTIRHYPSLPGIAKEELPWRAIFQRNITPDAEGNFSIEGLPEGLFQLESRSKPDLTLSPTEFTLSKGQQRELTLQFAAQGYEFWASLLCVCSK